MIKSHNLDSGFYHTSIRKSIESKRFGLLILFPLGLYGAFCLFEPEILSRILPYLPKESDKPPVFYQDLLRLVFSEMLWISGFLFLVWVIGVYVPLLGIIYWIERKLMKTSQIYVCSIIGLSFIVSLIIGMYTLEGFANSSDEYVYLYQAKTFSEGKLWEEGHSLPDFFYFNHIAQKDGISIGRFPPGWPVILSIAYIVGITPTLVNPLFGLLSLIVFYQFARRFYGKAIALWSLPMLAISSFYIFNSASFFSHSSCLLGTLVFVYGIYCYQSKERIKFLLVAGFSLGLMMTIRYYTAVIVSFPFFLYLIHQYRWKSIRIFFWIGLASLPCLAFGFWYNYSITGSPFLPVTMWAYSDESLGFVKGHTMVKGVEHVVRWILMFLYWCSPGLLILYFVYLWRKIRSKTERWIHPQDYMFIFLVIGYFFYYEIGGNQYGPRFFFETLPFVILFVVSNALRQKQKWALAILFAGSIYAVVKIPSIAQREHKVVEERMDVYRQVKENKISNAVVFLSSHTGIIRPMPTGDLTRNDVQYRNDVLYVLDLKQYNEKLMQFYPDRTFYKYVRDRNEVTGRLVRIGE